MINLQTLRNKMIDKTINVLNNVKYVPCKHDVALNKILDNPDTTDEQKLSKMRSYFHDAVNDITNA